MASVVLALAASLAWGVSDFLGGLASRRLPLTAVILVSQAVGLALMLPLASTQGSMRLDAPGVAFAVAGSLAGLGGIAAMYRGMATGAISIVGPISATGVVLPVVFGVVNGEHATPLQVAGSAIAVIGILLASRPASEPASGPAAEPRVGPSGGSGVSFGLLAALGFGGFFVLLHEASARDVLWASVVQRGTGVLVIGSVAVIRRPDLAAVRRLLPSLLAIGVLDTGANVLYAYASTLGQVSLAAILASLFPVVTVILARVVVHERLSASQGTGVVCALAGVALIAVV